MTREELEEHLRRIKNASSDGRHSYVDALMGRIEAIAAANLLAPEWISVTERLPDENNACLIWGPMHGCDIAFRVGQIWMLTRSGLSLTGVTFWTPIPKPIPAAPKDNHDD